MDKEKRKNRIVYRPPLWKRLFSFLGAVFFLLCLLSMLWVLFGSIGHPSWHLLYIVPIVGFCGFIAFVLFFSFIEHIFIHHLTLSDEGIEWNLTGTKGFSSWDNIHCFATVPISSDTTWNTGLLFYEPIEGEFRLVDLQMSSPRGAQIYSDAEEQLKTFLPLCEIVNINDFWMNPKHPLRQSIIQYAPELSNSNLQKNYDWERITQHRAASGEIQLSEKSKIP